MDMHLEKAREIPIRDRFEVIVCGGGAAGFVAAIAAARRGAKTLLIEKYGFLGGTGSAGLMVQFGSIFDGKQVLIGGCTHEFLHRLADEGYGYFYSEQSHSMIFDPEGMIAVCQEMVLESGARLLLHSSVVDVIKEGDRLRGVIVENKSGRSAYLADVLIDATGDGDLAVRAGERFDYGNAAGLAQPVSLEFILGNVDTNRFYAQPESIILDGIKKAKADNAWKVPTDQFFSYGRVKKKDAPDIPESAFFFINASNAPGIDGSNADDLSKAEIKCRRQVPVLLDFLRRYVPGFEKCYLDRSAAQIGVRETRRIRGKYTLTRRDVLEARHFDDGVVPGRNTIDVHHVKGEVFEHEYLVEGTHYQIPWRCFLPEKTEGLIITGRCLSADHYALGSTRVMVVCMPMGEACGIAAATACQDKTSLEKVDVAKVQKILRDQGTLI